MYNPQTENEEYSYGHNVSNTPALEECSNCECTSCKDCSFLKELISKH